MRHSPFLLAVAAVLALGACDKPAAGPKVDPAFGEKVRAYLMEHPEVIRDAINELQKKETIAAATSAKATLAKYRTQLERDSRDYVANPNGKITVVEFFDYNCGYCKVIAPEMMALIQSNPDVRFVFKDFTIFGEPSEYAAAGAELAKKNGRYIEVHKAFMSTKPLTDEAVARILTEHGIDPKAARAKMTETGHQAYIHDVQSLAQALQLEGTPAFVVGDVLIPGADAEALKRAIAAAKVKVS